MGLLVIWGFRIWAQHLLLELNTGETIRKRERHGAISIISMTGFRITYETHPWMSVTAFLELFTHVGKTFLGTIPWPALAWIKWEGRKPHQQPSLSFSTVDCPCSGCYGRPSSQTVSQRIYL